MRILLAAVGRMKAGPERGLVDRYLDRARKAGPAVGLTGFSVVEVAEGRQARVEARCDEEAEQLVAQLRGADLLILDEGGAAWTSRELAAELGRRRDAGTEALAVAIGGPDGHGAAVRARAAAVVSFGRVTFPHQIVRILAAEQLYRAVTLLSGHPYHRD